MLTIILGIVISALFLWLSEVVKDRGLRQMFTILAGTVFMVAVFYGLWSPVSGYGEWRLIKEIPMSEASEKIDFYQIKTEGIHDALTEPTVKVYERRGIKSIWTFAFGTKEIKYVFSITDEIGTEQIEGD